MDAILSTPNVRRGACAALVLGLVVALAPQAAMGADDSRADPGMASVSALQWPLAFEPNRGQADARVEFTSRGARYALFLGAGEATFALRAPASSEGQVVRMRLVGADPEAKGEGQDELASRSHYLRGRDPSRWTRDVPNYGQVRYRGVYPGIDLVYYGNQRQLEYDLVLAPGADPRAVQLAFDGVEALEVDGAGDLVLVTGAGRLVQRAPVIYQQDGDARTRIDGRYVLGDEGRVAIEVAAYDASRALVIDPVLVYSTYLGGSSIDGASSIAVDAAGNAYVAGSTLSADFPVSAGAAFPIARGDFDVFIAKLDANGSGLVYSTYLGGSGRDRLNAMALDVAGNVYVAGQTESLDFPVVNALQSAYGGGFTDGFAAKLDPSGSTLLYGTYLGGSGGEDVRGIAVDSSARAYLTGSTGSVNFPTSPGAFQTTLRGVDDAFVVKLDPALSGAQSLVYATFLGGNNFNLAHPPSILGPDSDRATAIAVDAVGNAHVAGSTLSSDFPVVNAVQPVINDFRDAFVTKLNASGTALVYSTFLGGTQTDEAFSIAVDAAGNAYVTGFAGHDFPVHNALQPTSHQFLTEAFVTKLDASGAFVYSTYLGGPGEDFGFGIAADSQGRAYVTGLTRLGAFPTASPLQGPGGLDDAFVARISPLGSTLDFSTYLGGNQADAGVAIAVDAAGAIYVAGGTESANFPVTAGAFQTAIGSSPFMSDGFVTKISFADGIVGSAGGTVVDDAATGASFSVPANVFAGNVSVTIEAMPSPGVEPPPGFTAGPTTAFVRITLAPNPSPLPAPGATIRLPLTAPLPAGTFMSLYRYDPSTGAFSATGILGRVDAGGTTATFAGVTHFSVFVGFVPAVTPFASFTAKLEAKPTSFELKGEFTLGAASDGIRPPAETVTLEAGTFSATLAAGRFTEDRKGRFKFEGTVGTTRLEIMIRPLGERLYEIAVDAAGAGIGATSPVNVRLAIGNDSGTTSVVPKR